jgi:hypothetical protein
MSTAQEVEQDVAMPIVSRLIDQALGILRRAPSNDPVQHQRVITRVLGEFNDAQAQFVAELAHLETGDEDGQFNVGVALKHRLLH